jgi:hypothetical protein
LVEDLEQHWLGDRVFEEGAGAGQRGEQVGDRVARVVEQSVQDGRVVLADGVGDVDGSAADRAGGGVEGAQQGMLMNSITNELMTVAHVVPVAFQRRYLCWAPRSAGGGFKGGVTYGQTDEFGFGAVENPVHVHDIHATILHQLGLDSRRLEIPGRKRLDIDHGQPIRELIG